MKLIATWEEKDIKPGKFYYRNADNSDVNTNLNYYLSVLAKIGYDSTYFVGNDGKYVGIAMNDGNVVRIGTKVEFAQFLTNDDYIPCTGEALTKLLAYAAIVYGSTN